MNKPYHERPDWILKSIVYFCDNYTIDGKDLRGMKRKAISTYCNGIKPLTEISATIDMSSAPGWEFWDGLYWLQGGVDCFGRPWVLPDTGVSCEPWTDYEKRKIAKMPEVK